MQVEIGDRVRIRHDQLPEGQTVHTGWEEHENGPGWGAPIEVQARQHWQDARGIVVGIDTLNDEVIVRGRLSGSDFVLVLPEAHVEITEQGVER